MTNFRRKVYNKINQLSNSELNELYRLMNENILNNNIEKIKTRKTLVEICKSKEGELMASA